MSQDLRLSTAFSGPPRRRARAPRAVLLVAAVVLICLLLFLRYIGVFGGNVRTVAAGRVYRCAELTGDNLDRVLAADHIRTVINLRGGSDKDAWYRSELAETARYGAKHFDVPLSARLYPPPERLQSILSLFDHAEYPVLFHCKGGSDRSGLVGTLYETLYDGKPLDEAEHEQLTWRYAHFSFGMAHAMDDFFTLYRKTSNGMGLRDWINKRYPALYARLPVDEKMQP